MKPLAVLALLCANAFAADPPPAPPTSAPAAKPGRLALPAPKEKFLEGFKAGLPDVFCADKTFFRKCFDTNAEACKKVTVTALATCITELDKELPAQFTKPQEGQIWGDKLGSCTGARVEAELPKAKNAGADCKDPNRWK